MNASDTPVTVFVTVTLDGSEEARIIAREARAANMPIFRAQPGFLGMDIYEEAGGDRILTELRWADEAAHLACMQSGDFGECPMMTLVQAGKAQLDVRVFRRVAGVGPQRAAA